MLLAGWCGLRAGEVLGLRRGDLDVAEAVLHVRQAVTRTTGEIHVGQPTQQPGSAMSASRHTFTPIWPGTWPAFPVPGWRPGEATPSFRAREAVERSTPARRATSSGVTATGFPLSLDAFAPAR